MPRETTPLPTPVLRPTPVAAGGAPIETALVDGWMYHERPGDALLGDGDGWAPIAVPGEPAMQGFDVAFDTEAGYRTALPIPAALDGERVILRFEGVYSSARVWVNGTHVGDHLGGFTRFEIDITHAVVPGGANVLVVGVTDRSDSVSTASNYAFHPIGGILRPVSLLVLPAVHLRRLQIDTLVDGGPRIRVQGDVADLDTARPHTATPEFALALTAPDGHPQGLAATCTAAELAAGIEIPVPDAELWSDENPALYTLDIAVGETRYRQRVGIREVRVDGNRLLVNGVPVLLRGINRHDIHPTLGRASDGTLERRDLELFRDANINFVRTSHYPPHPALLDAADELGIYVEVENAVCWADQFGWLATQDDERFRDEYVTPQLEVIERDRNHASVILWSLGNESTWGANFAASLAAARAADPTRPVIMSFSDEHGDIQSSHYPPFDAPLGDPQRPVLYDEIAHTPVYQSGALRRDPAIHADWALSIGDMLRRLRRSDGALGLAVWSGIDEQFALPSGTVGFGPWGIVDVWRRRKPEWWAMRAACSPVEIDIDALQHHAPGLFILPVTNRYALTNITAARFSIEGHPAMLELDPAVLHPGESGELRISLGTATDATLRTHDESGRVIDERWLDAGPARPERREPASAPPLSLDAHSGRPLIGTVPVDVWVDGPMALTWLEQHVSNVDDTTVVMARGSAPGLDAVVVTRQEPSGVAAVSFTLTSPDGAVFDTAAEIGLRLPLGASIDRTTWWGEAASRVAGTDYVGRARGVAKRDVVKAPAAIGDGDWREVTAGAIDRSMPDCWQRDFRAAKRGIREQIVMNAAGDGVAVRASGSIDTRLAPAREVLDVSSDAVRLVGEWARVPIPDALNQGSGGIADMTGTSQGASATVRFVGSAIDVVGALGPDLGIVDVLLDGEPFALGVDLFSPVHCEGHVIAHCEGLSVGEHELTVSVTGRQHRFATGIGVRLRSFESFASEPGVDLLVLAERRYPVSGSFDWMPPREESRGERVHATASFEIELVSGADSIAPG